MLSAGILFGVALLYLGLLFGVAYFGDRCAERGRSIADSPLVSPFRWRSTAPPGPTMAALGGLPPVASGSCRLYLGPTLGMALAWLVLLRMVRISKAYRITSIADFIASRYGKSQLLGGAVSLIALVGTVPYIALQLKAVASSFNLLVANPDEHLGLLSDTALYTALLLALFSILFGTRHLDATERHEGMVTAIAFESIVKLCAFWPSACM